MDCWRPVKAVGVAAVGGRQRRRQTGGGGGGTQAVGRWTRLGTQVSTLVQLEDWAAEPAEGVALESR